jgi:hypothetical protein
MFAPSIPPTFSEVLLRDKGNTRQIAAALRVYESRHGHLPYSERGSDAGLYMLRGAIDPDVFQAADKRGKAESPHWDTESERLINGDVLYFNEPHARLHNWQIILVMDLTPLRNYQIYALGCGIAGAWSPTIPARVLIGSWLTIEHFLIKDKDSYDQWCKLRPVDGYPVISYDGTRPVDEQLKDGSRFHYSYDGERLSRCQITTADGSKIIESIMTDEYGRIVEIHDQTTISPRTDRPDSISDESGAPLMSGTEEM